MELTVEDSSNKASNGEVRHDPVREGNTFVE
jgi:hypothetical protein